MDTRFAVVVGLDVGLLGLGLILLVALFLDNLQRYRDGQSLRGEVDFARGY